MVTSLLWTGRVELNSIVRWHKLLQPSMSTPTDMGGTDFRFHVCFIPARWFGFAEEAEDDDDPEYNFLDDLDEPDLEDYRTDRAVQITSRCRGRGAGLVNVDSGPSALIFLSVFQRRR